MLEASKGAKGTCTVGIALKDLAGDTADTFRQLFPKAVDGKVTYAAIAEAFTRRGHKMVGSTVSRHARRKCECDA